jgi:sugar/nucleoside kinase (ribokinase family)
VKLSRRQWRDCSQSVSALDVVGIGDAVVDVIAQTDDEFLASRGLVKGSMNPIEAEQAEALYAAMGPVTEVSGGSAANTIVGLRSLGARVGYIGKVRQDLLGSVFQHDMHSLGVRFPTRPVVHGPPTARCLILVTPDAQRTLNTYPGASAQLGPGDVEEGMLRAAQITFLCGFLFDRPHGKQVIRKAAAIAHRTGRRVALTLADTSCVDRHHDDVLDIVRRDIDVLFANESEITALFGTVDIRTTVREMWARGGIAAVTRSEKGSVVLTRERTLLVPAAAVRRVVDTTGAGDLYASGFLYGLTRGMELPDCGRLASLCAAEGIGHLGARPQTSLQSLLLG